MRILEIIATAKLKLNWAGTVKADKMAEAINAEGGTAIAVGGDVTKNEDIKTLVEKAAELGRGKINIIINNAGYALDDPIEKIKDEQWGRLSLSCNESFQSRSNSPKTRSLPCITQHLSSSSEPRHRISW